MSIRIKRIALYLYRAAVNEPIKTSFGSIADRTTMLIRVEDEDGAAGWGEVWCSIPAYSAENKIHLMQSLVAPLVIGAGFADPADVWFTLSDRLHRIAMQCGEQGPVAACLAGLDVALWDMQARRAGVPLRELIAGPAVPATVPAYASGLNPATAVGTVVRARAQGFTAFKAKLGFGYDNDLALLDRLAATLREGESLMVDANQGWDMTQARRILPRLAQHRLRWIEEPVLATTPASEWAELAMIAGAPLAGGENLAGFPAFAGLVSDGHHRIVQPDTFKWGGITGTVAVARMAVAAGLSYCPHWLGGGLGLLVSAQLLAAVGGPGLLEYDVMENPLRDAFFPLPPAQAGVVQLPDTPGLGPQPDREGAAKWLVHAQEFTA